MLVGLGNNELYARVGLDLDLADPADGHERARRVIRLQPVAHPEPAGRGEPLRPDERAPRQRGDVPGRWLDRASDHQEHKRRRGRQRNPVPASPRARVDLRRDLGPQVARRLDALRQLINGVQQLPFVHRSNFSRSRRRARNSCAFDVPAAIPTSSAISPCP